MPKANSQGRNAALQSGLNGANRFVCQFRVARAIGYDNTIKGESNVWCEEVKIPWDGNHTHISRKETTCNIALNTTVNQDNSSISTSFLQNLPGRNLCNQVIIIWIIERNILIEHNLAQHCAVGTNMLSKQTRIFDLQGRYFFLLQPGTEIHCILPMRGRINIVGNDQPRYMDPVVFPVGLMRHSVVPYDWVSQG